MEVDLTFKAEGLDDNRMMELTLDLRKLLEHESRAEVRAPDAAARVGQRGDPVTVGALVLAALASPVLAEAFETVRAFVSRDRSFVIEIANQGGRTLRFEGTNLSHPTRREIESFVRDLEAPRA